MNKEKYPQCFGVIDSVFPKQENKLRLSPSECSNCYHKTECLKSAINGPDGLKVKEEFVDRAYESGVMGFFKRWSKKKNINRELKKQRSGDKNQK